MYANEINRIMELKKEISIKSEKVVMINHFLRTYSSSFTSEESIKALDRIEKFMKEMINKRVNDEEDIQKISKMIDCEHEILLRMVLEYECPICKRKFNKLPSSKYVIHYYYDYDKDEEEINNIIFNSSKSDVCEELLDYFSHKQSNSNIEIMRLKKWKEKN